MTEPDEGTLHEICWDVLLNDPGASIGKVALEVATRTAEACLGHAVRPVPGHPVVFTGAPAERPKG